MVAAKQTLIAWLLLAGSAFGQIQVPAETAPYQPLSATVNVEGTGECQVIWDADAAAQFLASDDGRTIHIWATPGVHRIEALVQCIDWAAKTSSLKKYEATFAVVDENPTPVPPLPEPDPPKPVPPTPVGKLTAVIVHETEDDTPAIARTFIRLRSGEAAKWLKEKGHKLVILDDDMTDTNAKQTLATLKSLGVKMPAMFVLDSTDKVLASRELSDTTTADNVIEYIRQAGG